MDYSRELQEALAAARAAGEYLRAEYAAFTPIPNAPAHISTHADRESQEVILRHLRAAFPADGLVAEEKTPTVADAPANPDRQWVIDPIDGTRGFAIKNGEFSVMIALTVGGRPVVGVVLEPVSGRLTYASAGLGCWKRDGGGEPLPCRVTACDELAAAVLTQSHSKPGKPKPVQVKLAPARVVETYSAGIKMALVARGEADLYVNDYPEFRDWDICAGEVLVVEAGGAVTEYTGSPVRYGLAGAKRRSGLVASNGRVHAAAIERLR